LNVKNLFFFGFFGFFFFGFFFVFCFFFFFFVEINNSLLFFMSAQTTTNLTLNPHFFFLFPSFALIFFSFYKNIFYFIPLRNKYHTIVVFSLCEKNNFDRIFDRIFYSDVFLKLRKILPNIVNKFLLLHLSSKCQIFVSQCLEILAQKYSMMIWIQKKKKNFFEV
jgi:hypothetical protein